MLAIKQIFEKTPVEWYAPQKLDAFGGAYFLPGLKIQIIVYRLTISKKIQFSKSGNNRNRAVKITRIIYL